MPHRTITDSSGATWDVWETKPGPRSRVSPIYRDGWLTFEMTTPPAAKRRLAPIPAHWHVSDDRELLALLDSATEVAGSRRNTVVALEESSAPPTAS